MKTNRILTTIAAVSALTSCADDSSKSLVLYYSQTGTTKAVAEEIASQTGSDLISFDVKEVYDGDFDATIKRCLEERQTGFLPTLITPDADISKYDVVFLGFPIWFGTYAPPVKALIESGLLEGKVIVPFCTFGSGGLFSGSADLKAALPTAEIREGYGVRAARLASMAAEVQRFLIENGYKEGEVELLPGFGPQEPVTEEQTATFDAACSGYQFPLGTPVTAASRKIPSGIEYLFVAESSAPDGRLSTSRIYVIAEDGKAPEFTQVIR